MQQVPYQLVLHMGDVAYGSGAAWELERNHFAVYQRMLQSFPLFPSIGNHDDATDEAAPYLVAFDLPDNGIVGERERFYSFDWGQVHFVALDTERMTDVQARWLDADLSENRLPWVVVYGHRPPYSSGSHGSNITFRERFGSLLYKHRVSLVLSGHEHSYERTKPIDGTVYVVSGGGGRETRPVGRSEFTAYSESVLHFVYVEADSEALVLHAIDGIGREFDSVRLVPPRKRP
jgi:hypothetical protein